MSELDEMNVEIHNDKDKLFYYVITRDRYMLRTKLNEVLRGCKRAKDEYKLLKKKVNAFGANIIHQAYLIEAYDIAHWLVESFPEVALEPYSDQLPQSLRYEFEGYKMPYSGQNILHMVIVRRNYVEVRWLLDFFKDHKDSVPNGLKMLLVANATGQFFDRDGDFYFGGYPLQFAVCSNSIEIFDLVLSFASSLESDGNEYDGGEEASTVLGADVPSLGPNVIFMRDTYGNTVLHLCVMHCLQDMFDHVYKVAETIITRELKILYAKQYESHGHFETESFETKSKIVTGYHIRPRITQFPADSRKYEEWVISETTAKLKERLLLVLNNDLHSLITLASTFKSDETSQKLTRKIDMLKYLLRKLKSLSWTFGKVQCSEFDLAGLEVKYDLSEYVIKDRKVLPPHNSAISWLCINDVENAMMIPEIRRVIEIKWERCGLIYYLKSFVLDIIIVILLTLVLVYGNYTPTRSTNHAMDWFVNIIYALIVVIFVGLVVSELIDIIRFKSVFRNVRGMALFHVICRLVEMISFVIFSTNKYAKIQTGQIDKCAYNSSDLHPQDINEIKVPLIICVMTSWVHLYYYLLGFKNTGLFVLTMTKIIMRDIPHFFRFFTISLFAFASAISMLGNTGNYHTRFSFWRYIKTLWTLIHETVNNSSPDDQTSLALVPKDLQWLSDIWNTLFYYGVAYVMLNLLIAIINSTYSFYTSYNDETKGYNNEAILLMEKFNVMDYLEHHLPPDELHEYRDKYAMVKPIESVPLMSDTNDYDEYETHELNHQKSYFAPPPHQKFKYFFQLQDDIPGWMAMNEKAILSKHKKSCLLIINPQNDFYAGGPLAMLGAEKDSAMIAKMIVEYQTDIHDIIVLLNSRHISHISHSKFWVAKNGNNPAIGTTITNESIKGRVWLPQDAGMLDWCLKYTTLLERKGKKLRIVPKHCIIGTRGHAIVPAINAALQEWASVSQRPLAFVESGHNCRTEMFSALEAEVEDPLDGSTGFNSDLMANLRISEKANNSLFINSVTIISYSVVGDLWTGLVALRYCNGEGHIEVLARRCL